MTKHLIVILAVVCLLVPLVGAQTAPDKDQPSRYMWFALDQVNSGKFPVYADLITQYRSVVNTTAPDIYWIAGAPITGSYGRFASASFHDNLASVEKMLNQIQKIDKEVSLKYPKTVSMSAESLANSTVMLAEYSKEISYRPMLVPMPNATYWMTELVGLNPGCDNALNEVAKQVITLHQKANDDEHWAAYNIRGGYPQPSVLFVTGLRSLADLDQETPLSTKETFSNPMVRQALNKFDHECVRSVETNYIQIMPQLSRPHQALVAANPAFWTVKDEPTVAAKKGKNKTPTPGKEMAKGD